MVLELWDAEDERLVAKPCNEEEGIFHVVGVNFGIVAGELAGNY